MRIRFPACLHRNIKKNTIRHDIEEDFKAAIGDRIEAVCAPLGVKIAYAYRTIMHMLYNCIVMSYNCIIKRSLYAQ